MRWMVRDLLRKADRLGVDLNPSVTFPFNLLAALRVGPLSLSRVEKMKLMNALFDAVWVRGIDVSGAEELAGVVDEAGLDARDLMERGGRQKTKAPWREKTSAAIAEGVFGVPTMIVDGRLFWGYDDFEHLDALLRDDDVFDGARISEWENVRPGALRKAGRQPTN